MRCKNATIGELFFFIVIILNSSNLQPQTNLDPPEFSVTRGFYEESFDLTITAPEGIENASIRYTTDGSDPQTSSTTLTQTSPVTIRINPDSSYGVRGKNPGVIVRACSITPDNIVSESVTHTYLFVKKVKELSPEGVKPGSGWPNPTTSGNPQAIDYGLDPAILNDSRYKDLFDDALLAIPTISVSTDLKNLFDLNSGIYMNAYNDGVEWERPASIELLNPDSTEGFQINAGIRIRGGWSRWGENPKHAFRLFFRSEYGKAKLKFPLFGNEGVDEFDKVDLRTSQNYSWSYPGHQGEYNTMNRDVFSRDLQREIGQPYTRSRYYHLYLDGAYWGLFQTQERSEARYAESYFGGNVEDYDVIKAGFPDYRLEATDGNLDAWQVVWNMCVSGFQNNSNYFRLQGLNEDGSINPSYKVLVDIDNLIDYMLIIFYAGNFDAPTSKFGGNGGPNNFFCVYNRNGRDGFKFFAHDAEHTLRTTSGEGPGIGLNENRVSIGMTVGGFSSFHPQWLHYKLSSNAEYRIRFADHIYKHFFNQGCMTPEKTTNLFVARAKEIELAIIGESARWGDMYLNPPGTKDLWQWAVDDIINNYFPYRTGIVLSQLKSADLYPNIDPPVFYNNVTEVIAKTLDVQPGYKLKLINPGANGTIQYTVDGTDPRKIGGDISGSSNDGGNEIEITVSSTTVIKTRIKNGSTWSAIHEIILFADNGVSNLKVTEIHYHPADEDSVIDDDNDYEFLELKNIGTSPINLSQAFFDNGITYTFPAVTIVNPGEFIVLGSNSQDFNDRYGFLPFGEYSGQLDNGGERITLLTAVNDTIYSILYDDQAPWPETPDTFGYSLVPIEINPTGDQNDPLNWRASYNINGSPGRDDLPTSVENPKTEIPDDFRLDQNYPNPFNPSTIISYQLPASGLVTLKIYDVLGREVTTLINEFQNAGIYKVHFNRQETTNSIQLSSGIYFYRLQTTENTITRKMILLK
jgi:hypothetical protein